MKRLSLLLVPLSLQVACLEVEHKIGLRESGAVDYALRVGLDNKYAESRFAKPPEERDRDWKARLPDDFKSYLTAHVEAGDPKTWLVIDGTLPDVGTYLAFRGAFQRAWERDQKPNAMVVPPEIDDGVSRTVIRADLLPTDPEFVLPQEAWEAGATWRLVVSAPTTLTVSEGFVLSEDGRTATFEKPLLEVTKQGTFAEARVSKGLGSWIGVGLLALAVVGLGAGVAVALGRRA